MQISKAFVWIVYRTLTVFAVLPLATTANAQLDLSTSLIGNAPASIQDLERQAFEILFGINPSDDVELAMRLLMEAAEAGSAVAADRLSFAYGTGEGVPMDLAEAFRLQRQAAQAGSASAQLRVGLQYLSGAEVDADPIEARKWLEAAAAQGDARALFALAGTYLEATYAETDMDLLLPPLARAAELGEPAALRQLGTLLLRDQERLDPERGLHALEQAAATFPELATTIGLNYLAGRVVERDLERAVRWLSEGEAAGNLGAKVWIAELHERGLGLAQDLELAEEIRGEILRSASARDKNTIAWDLSINADPFLRNGELAVRLMESLLDSPEIQYPAMLDTLAAAYAEAGRFDDAIATQQRAIDLLDAPSGETAEAQPDPGGYRERLALYRTGQPYRRASQ